MLWACRQKNARYIRGNISHSGKSDNEPVVANSRLIVGLTWSTTNCKQISSNDPHLSARASAFPLPAFFARFPFAVVVVTAVALPFPYFPVAVDACCVNACSWFWATARAAAQSAEDHFTTDNSLSVVVVTVALVVYPCAGS